MKVKIENFTMTSDSQGGYNLTETRIIDALGEDRKPTGELKEITVERGFNMSIQRCIEKMIHLRLHSIDNTVDFRGFLELYRGERSRIEGLVQEVLTIA